MSSERRVLPKYGKCCQVSTACVLVPIAALMATYFEPPSVVEVPRFDASQAPAASAGGAKERAGSPAVFERIDWAYDFANRWVTHGIDRAWREHLVRECVRPTAGDRVLDLGAGSADVSIAIAFRFLRMGGGSEGEVLSLDRNSNKELCRGMAKVSDESLESRVKFGVGDSQNLSSIRTLSRLHGLSKECREAKTEYSLGDGSIDKVAMAFGIRGAPDRDLALREVRRVMRSSPSSRACFLEFSMPDGSGFGARLSRFVITRLFPALGWAATFGKAGGGEHTYLTETIADFPRPHTFADAAASAGLQVSNITHFAFGAVQMYTASPILPGTVE